MANAGTHRLSMANTSDNNTKRRKNNAQNEIKYLLSFLTGSNTMVTKTEGVNNLPKAVMQQCLDHE